jgi:hypothetical protein
LADLSRVFEVTVVDDSCRVVSVLKGLVNSILVVLFVVVSLLLLLLLVPVKQATSLTLLIFLDIPEGSSCSIPLDFF